MSRPLADPLLEHAPYVRSLSRALVYDPHLARDVEQEVLLAALSNAPRERGAVRAWLAVLVRNFAVKAWRSSSRRERREREAARPEALVPSPAEILEREDRRRALVERVLELDEPLRAVLVLRFLEDLPPRTVARRLRIPVETVRSRTRRGLVLLRERLDREQGGREAWCLALVGALRVPASPASLAGALASSSLAGVVAMSLTKKIAAGAVVLALVAAVAQRGRGSDAGDVPVTEPVELVATPSVEPSAPPARPEPWQEAAAGARETLAPPVAPSAALGVATTGSLLLRVAWHDGTPAADVAASVTPRGVGEREIGVLDARTGPDGACLVAPLAPGRASVRVDRAEDYVHAEIAAGEEAELLVTLPRGYDVEGDVTHAGAPVAFAEVWLDRSFVGWGGHRVARADAQGHYRIRSIEDGLSWIGARAPGFAPSTGSSVMGGTGATLDVPLELTGPGGVLAGTVVGADGLPLEGAEVLVGDELQRPVGPRKTAPSAQRVASDASGAFRLEGVAPGLRPVQARAPGRAPWSGEIDVAEGATATLAITLLPGAIVRGHVTDGEGQPLASAYVSCGKGFFADRSLWSAADGSFELRDLPVGEIELVADAEERGRASATLRSAPGEELVWDPVVEGLSLAGTVALNGLDATRLRVRCVSERLERPYLADARVDADGRFVLEGLADEPYVLSVHAAADGFPFALLERRGVRPEDGDVLLEPDPALWPSIRLRGRVVDADGNPVRSAAISPSLEGRTNAPLLSTGEDGAFDVGPYPPGRWRVRFGHSGAGTSTEAVDVPRDATHDFGDLRLPR